MTISKLDVDFGDFALDGEDSPNEFKNDSPSNDDKEVGGPMDPKVELNQNASSTEPLDANQLAKLDEDVVQSEPMALSDVVPLVGDERAPESDSFNEVDTTLAIVDDNGRPRRLFDGLEAITEESEREYTSSSEVNQGVTIGDKVKVEEEAPLDSDSSASVSVSSNVKVNGLTMLSKNIDPTKDAISVAENINKQVIKRQIDEKETRTGGDYGNGVDTFETYVQRLENVLIPEGRLEQYGIEANSLNVEDPMEVSFFGIASGQYQILNAIYGIETSTKGGAGGSNLMNDLLKALERHSNENDSVSTIVNGFAMESVKNSQKMIDENKGIWKDYVDELKQTKRQLLEDKEKLMGLLNEEQMKNKRLENILENIQSTLKETSAENAKLNQWVQVMVSQSNAMSGSRFGRSRYRNDSQPQLIGDLSAESVTQSEDGSLPPGPTVLSSGDIQKVYASGNYNRPNAMVNRGIALKNIKERIKYKKPETGQ